MQWTEWRDLGRHEQVLGHRVFVRQAVQAGKPLLLLLHGFPTSSMDFHRIWDGLAARWSLLALDFLGFGLSAKPREGPYTIAFQAQLCLALLERLGHRRPALLAHDYGVSVAQELLALEQEGQLELSQVDFLNGGLFPEAHRPRLIQRLLARPRLGPWLVRCMRFGRYAATMRSIAGRNAPEAGELREQWQLLNLNGGLQVMPALLDYMAQRRRMRERWVRAMQSTQVPLRLVCGAADPISGAHLAARFRELLPAARVHLLPEVGHYPQLEAPAAVLACLEAD